MTKQDNTLTKTSRKIREENRKTNSDVMETVVALEKSLVNMQQMSAQLAVHIVLSLPLSSSSHRCIFINTSPQDQRAFVLKKKKVLQ